MEPSGRSQTGYYNVSLAGLGHVAKEMVHCNGWIVRLLNTNLSGDKENHSVLDIMYTFPLLSSLWLVHQGTECGWWFIVASSMFIVITAKSHSWHCCCIEVKSQKLLLCCCSRPQCCSKLYLLRHWFLRNEVIGTNMKVLIILPGSNIALCMRTHLYTHS